MYPGESGSASGSYRMHRGTVTYINYNTGFRQTGLPPNKCQMEKYTHRRNVILEIMKAHYNIVKTRPSNFNCWNINAIAMGPTDA